MKLDVFEIANEEMDFEIIELGFEPLVMPPEYGCIPGGPCPICTPPTNWRC